jgi:hypothetical protein
MDGCGKIILSCCGVEFYILRGDYMNIHYEENLLTASQFLLLREAVGWHGVESQIERALIAGLYNILAKDENDVVGMGRLVGDCIM